MISMVTCPALYATINGLPTVIAFKVSRILAAILTEN